jgi:site-specific recombinase XerD
MQEPKLWYRKQTKTWYVTFNGKQKSLGRDEEAARKKYHELLAQNGRPAADESVYNLCNRYLAYYKANLAEGTFVIRRRHLRRFTDQLGKRLLTSQVKPFHVRDVLEEQYKECSGTYKHDAVTYIKAVFSWSLEQGYIDKNPLVAVKKPRRGMRETFLKAVEWQRVLDAASDERFREYLVVAFSSGARPQEMRKIEARHVDLDGQRIIFPTEESKGRKHSRVIYLDDLAFEIIKRLCEEWPQGMIFRNRRGRPWSKDAIKDRFKRLKEKLNMPGLCATVLRHSFAHHKLISGVDSLVVSELMGHVDGRMLATRYGHLEDNGDFMRNAANANNPLRPDTA